MITFAAIKHKGNIHTGRNHGEITTRMFRERLFDDTFDYEEGFINERGEFLTREQAAKHAFEIGQIKDKKFQLFSYDLWKE